MHSSTDCPDQQDKARNFYDLDVALRRWLTVNAAGLEAEHRQRLRDFGIWVASEVDAAASYTDRFAPPQLQMQPAESDPQAIGTGAILASNIVQNPAYLRVHREVYERGIVGLNYGSRPDPFLLTFIMGYLLAQADISIHCPVTLTGAVAYVLDRFAPPPVKAAYLSQLKRQDGRAASGGTWATERQGGSDIGANRTIAHHRDNGTVTLHGLKWFCSNAASDLALATARPDATTEGGEGLGLYLVPRLLADGSANHYRVRRLKEKLGTRGLATGEIELQGAIALEIAAPPRGLRVMMEALAFSRIHNAVAAAGVQRRAFLEALSYAQERRAFNAALIDQPMVRAQLLDLQMEHEASLALALTAAQAFDAAQPTDASTHGDAQTWLRLLTALAKYRTAEQAVRCASAAIEILGGNGYTDDYVTPRLLRDAQVLPVWEGPANIQALEVLRLLLGRADGGAVFADRVAILLESGAPQMASDAGILRQTLQNFRENLIQLKQQAADASRHGFPLMELMADLACAALLLRDAGAELAAGDRRKALLAGRYISRRLSRQPHAGPSFMPDAIGHRELDVLLYRPVPA